jgi:lipooligosaccharide transport system permease protein
VRVLSWHLTSYRRLWRLNVLATFAQPVLYLLGLGIGVGALVDRNTGSTDVLGGVSYVAYVGPGLLMTVAMAIGAAESMWPVMGGLRWNRGYHGIAATPLGATDIVLGHALWMVLRSGLAAASVATVLAVIPDTRSWGLVACVPVASLVGAAFAMPIMPFAIHADFDAVFPALQRFVIIPLFLFGGAFYPLSQLPEVVQWVARVAPLWHGVTVARQATTGGLEVLPTVGHLAYLSLWIAAGTLAAVRQLRRKLYP